MTKCGYYVIENVYLFTDNRQTNWMLFCWRWWFDWSFARFIAPVFTTTSFILSFSKTCWPRFTGKNGHWNGERIICYTRFKKKKIFCMYCVNVQRMLCSVLASNEATHAGNMYVCLSACLSIYLSLCLMVGLFVRLCVSVSSSVITQKVLMLVSPNLEWKQ